MNLKVTIEEAQQILLEAAAVPSDEEIVSLDDSLGRVVYKNINAPYQLPLFNKSPLDGYAMRSEDIQTATAENPVILEVQEEYHAGYMPDKPVVKGKASKLMTGAPMPEGADIVIKYEDIERIDNKIKVFYPLKKNSNVIFAGEDVKRGECIVKAGAVINPAMIGALAAVGVSKVSVQRKIKVALISTGDELIDPAEPLVEGKIFNSNLHGLKASVTASGAEAIVIGTVIDDKDKIKAALMTALDQADIVITTGGVSVGDYDFIPDCIKEVGAQILFKGVKIKPGSPAIAAKFHNKIILGLSGNAAAASITFQLLAVPLIKKIQGRKETFFPNVKARLMNDFSKTSPQRRILRGRFTIESHEKEIYLTGSQTNGSVQSMIDCNALIDVPSGSDKLYRNQEVSVILIGGF